MKSSSFILLIIFFVPAIIFGFSLDIQNKEDVNLRSINRRDILDLLKSFIKFPKFYLVPHEFGHVLATKILLKNVTTTVHFGLSSYEQNDFLLKLGNVKFHSFDISRIAYASRNEKGNNIQEIIIASMGLIFGVLSLLLMKKMINKLDFNFIRNVYIRGICYVYNLFINYCILNQIFYGFTPLYSGYRGDGYIIYKLLGADDMLLKKCLEFDQHKTLLFFMSSMITTNYYLDNP